MKQEELPQTASEFIAMTEGKPEFKQLDEPDPIAQLAEMRGTPDLLTSVTLHIHPATWQLLPLSYKRSDQELMGEDVVTFQWLCFTINKRKLTINDW